jgi:hypothetical protein
MKINEVATHGEVFFTPTAKIPNGAKKIKSSDRTFYIVGESQTAGNHHVVDIIDGVDFFEDEKGVLFMESSVETNIRCIHENRHDTIKIPAGTYEFGTQQEYDPFAALMVRVRV